MLEAYKVGISLVLESNISTAVEGAAEQFKTLDRIIKNTQSSVNELAASMRVIGKVGASAAREWSNAARAMDRAAASTSRAAAAMRGAGAAGFAAGAGDYGAGPRASRAEPGASAAGLLSYYGLNDGAVVPYRGTGLPVPYLSSERGFTMGPGGEPGTGFRTRGDASFGTFAPYVGAPGGGGPGGDGRGPGDRPPLLLTGPEGPEGGDARFMEGERYVRDVSRPRRHSHIGIGHLAITDWAGYEAGKGIFEPTFEEAREESMLLGMGFTQAQVQQAYKEADKVRRTAPGSSILSNLSIASQLMAITQNASEAIGAMPEFAKFAISMNAVSPGSGGPMTGALMAAMRGGEYRGVLTHRDPVTGKESIDIAGMTRWLHLAETIAYMTHGTVGPQQLFTYLRSSGIAGSQQSDKSIIESIAMQIAMGSSRAGTALQAFATQFQAGKMAKGNYTLLQDLGLVSKDRRTWRKLGMGYIEMLPGAMPMAERMMAVNHPEEFVLKYVEPRAREYLAKHYGKEWTMPGATPEERVTRQFNLEAAFLQEIASRQPGGVNMAEVIRNHLLQLRDLQQAAMLSGMNPETFQPEPGKKPFDYYANQVANNPYIQVHELQASWQAMMISIGKTDLKPAVKALDDVSHIIDDIGSFSKAHPGTTRAALDALIAGFVSFNVIMAGKGIVGAGKLLRDMGKGFDKMESPLERLTAKGGIIALAVGLDRLAKATTNFPHWLIDAAAGAAIGGTVAGAPGAAVGAVIGGGKHLLSVPMPTFAYDQDRDAPWLYRMTGLGPSHMPHVTLPPGHDSGPVQVTGHVTAHVTNPKDIATGVTGHIVSKSRLPPAGYSGLDLRADPWSAGLQAGVP